MRNGITPVVAVVILLGMAVAAAGGSYAWITTTTQQAQSEASESLATGITARSVSCGGGTVDIAVSNTGDRAVDISDASLFVRSDGDLVSGRTGVSTGRGTLPPGGFARFTLLADAAIRDGTAYDIELRFPGDDVAARATCDGGAVSRLASAYWRMDENVTATDGFEGGTDGASIPGTTDWVVDEWALEFDSGQVAEGSLSAYTTSVDPGCPLMHRRMFDRERNVSRFTGWYRETSGSTGHGVSLRDADRDRILGWYTNNPQFGVYSADGFDGGQDTSSLISGLSYSTWYQVNVTIDWTSRNATVVHSGNASKTLGPYPVNGSPQYLYAESADDNNWECNPKDSWLDGFTFRTDVTDRSRNGNNLAFPADRTMEPTWDATCGSDGCLVFDGTDDHMVGGDRAAFDFGSGNFSVFARGNQDAQTNGCGQPSIVSKGYGGNTGQWTFSVKDQDLKFYADGSSYESDVSLSTGEWYRVGVVRRGDDLEFYRDGTLEEVSTGFFSGATLDSSRSFRIGRNDDSCDMPFDGRIDEVLVVPYAVR